METLASGAAQIDPATIAVQVIVLSCAAVSKRNSLTLVLRD
jgi:hypothetical protein